MFTKDQQKAVLSTVVEGNIFEVGELFSKMAPKEKVTWEVLERIKMEDGSERITMHLYILDVFFQVAVGVWGKGEWTWITK